MSTTVIIVILIVVAIAALLAVRSGRPSITTIERVRVEREKEIGDRDDA